MRALHKDPGERYTSASEFRSALVAAARDSRDAPITSRAFTATGDALAWTRLDLPHPRARGTSAPPVRDPHVVIEAALDATRRLIAQRRMSAARDELEAALRIVEGDEVAERMAWRLLLALAAVSDALRDPRRARELARRALDCAARNGSDAGRRRAKALIERFAGRSRLC